MQSNTRKTTGDVKGRRTHDILIGGPDRAYAADDGRCGRGDRGLSKSGAHATLGYDPHNVMSVGIPIHDGTYKTWPERAAYFEQMFAKSAETFPA